MRPLIAALLVAATWLLSAAVGSSRPTAAPCFDRWQVEGHQVKDHALFEHDGWWYILSTSNSIPRQEPFGERDFLYARTRDFCRWENLGVALSPGPAGSSDESYLWAPHVVREGDLFYMFYTGVNRNIAQSIMLATTRDPSDPGSWQKQGVIFLPDHEGMVYPGPDYWSDARDPMVLPYQGRYYLYYTGVDVDGGIIGVADAESIDGPYQDRGAVLRDVPESRLESPFVILRDGYAYLYYNRSGNLSDRGERWRWSSSPLGPWQPATRERIGWAHDFGELDGSWISSFVIGDGHAIGFAALAWQDQSSPPTPIVGSRLYFPWLARPHVP